MFLLKELEACKHCNIFEDFRGLFDDQADDVVLIFFLFTRLVQVRVKILRLTTFSLDVLLDADE